MVRHAAWLLAAALLAAGCTQPPAPDAPSTSQATAPGPAQGVRTLLDAEWTHDEPTQPAPGVLQPTVANFTLPAHALRLWVNSSRVEFPAGDESASLRLRAPNGTEVQRPFSYYETSRGDRVGRASIELGPVDGGPFRAVYVYDPSHPGARHRLQVEAVAQFP